MLSPRTEAVFGREFGLTFHIETVSLGVSTEIGEDITGIKEHST